MKRTQPVCDSLTSFHAALVANRQELIEQELAPCEIE